jgi:hypothetical protein
MRHERWNVDEVARARVGGELAGCRTASGPAGDYVDHAFDVAVMMGAGFGVGMDDDSLCPQLFGARTRP